MATIDLLSNAVPIVFYALGLGARALTRPVISPLHTLVSACKPWSIDATEIEEDLAGFRSLDQRLLNITRAQDTTATKLLESSEHCNTWKYFKERDPQRIQDLESPDTYVWIIKSNKHASFTFEVVREVEAAHLRISHDLYDLLVILASVDSTRKYTTKKRDREIERLERRLAATKSYCGRSLKLRQNKQDLKDLEEEERVWGVTPTELLISQLSIHSDSLVLNLKGSDLLHQRRRDSKALERRKPQRW